MSTMDLENRRIFYNGEQENYDYFHEHYGVTFTRSTVTSVYNNSLQEFTAWIENDTGNKYVFVLDVDQNVEPRPDRSGHWYSQDGMNYWFKSNTTDKIYYISEELHLDKYTKRNEVLYNYNGELASYQSLHDLHGITRTPSHTYYIKNGVPICWYNQDEELPYWDVATTQWCLNPPVYGEISVGTNDIGSVGLFLYIGSETRISYGSIVDGSNLKPACLSFPVSGELSVSKAENYTLTGSWKILSEVSHTTNLNDIIVFASKISEAGTDNATNNANNTSNSVNEYNL